MGATDVYLLLLGASLGISVAVLAVAAIARQLAPSARLNLAVLMLCGAAFHGFATPLGSVFGPSARPWLLGLSACGVVALWNLVRLLFDPRHVGPAVWRQPLAIAVVGVVLPVVLGKSSEGLRLATSIVPALSVVLVAHMLAVLVRGRTDDLDDYRRMLRLVVAACAGLYVLAVVAAHGLGWLSDSASPTMLALVAAQIAFKLAWLLLATGDPSPMRRVYEATHGPVPSVHEALVAADPPASAEPMPSIAEANAARHARQMLAAFEREHMYREPGLTIRLLAQRLDMPEHRLRVAINGHLGFKNYSAFLNHYRLREVAQRLRDPASAHLPILTIALDAGFGSLAPFNRAFRDAFGLAPSDYRRGDAAVSHVQTSNESASISNSIGIASKPS